jgi:3'(2'), 5'-bisphosphate nucleotidase
MNRLISRQYLVTSFLIPIAILAASFVLTTSPRLFLARISPAFFSTSPATLRAMSSPSYAKELEVAQLAVSRASILTKKVFHEKVKGTISKSDNSPVTVADYGAQALIISAILKNFPNDRVVGEEDAAALRENPSLKEEVWKLVSATHLNNETAEGTLGTLQSADEALEAIDNGNDAGGRTGRVWALDPIDGTKGFLRGGQYAVCLALMIDGEPKVGVLGCPNLPVDARQLVAGDGADQTDEEGKGVLLSAVVGHGATAQPLSAGALADGKEIKMRPVEKLEDATFCESVEAGHSSHSDQASIASLLNITKPSVRMDSQAKYASIARGAGDIYLRLPVSASYEEKIWDHAAGYVIVREAGGKVTDCRGEELDFGIGRTLKNNKGIVAAPGQVHGTVMKAVKEVLEGKHASKA